MITLFKVLVFLPIGALILSVTAIWITGLIKTRSDFKNYSSNLSFSFKDFITFYNIFPDKWIISESQDKVFYKARLNNCYSTNQEFLFITLKDIIQFRYWRKFVYKKILKRNKSKRQKLEEIK